MIREHKGIPAIIDGEDGTVDVIIDTDHGVIAIEFDAGIEIAFTIDTLRQLVQQYDDDVKYGEQNK